VVNPAPITGATNLVDGGADLTQSNAYFVRPIFFGAEQGPSASYTLPANAPTQQYLRIPLQRPAGGVTPVAENYTYSPIQCRLVDTERSARAARGADLLGQAVDQFRRLVGRRPAARAARQRFGAEMGLSEQLGGAHPRSGGHFVDQQHHGDAEPERGYLRRLARGDHLAREFERCASPLYNHQSNQPAHLYPDARPPVSTCHRLAEHGLHSAARPNPAVWWK